MPSPAAWTYPIPNKEVRKTHHASAGSKTRGSRPLVDELTPELKKAAES
jgi:hypothetical protein